MAKIQRTKIACITLDLEPDHAGCISQVQHSCWEPQKIKKLIDLLKKHKVPLSVFVVAKSLEKNKKTIGLFQKYNCEFYLHSFSHNIKEPDSTPEIKKAKEAFRKFFGENPKGYRAPLGLITDSGLKALAKQGFEFDASIIPSFWPSPKYLKYSKYPFYVGRLSEIPFSTISPVRFVVALSWIKLFGPKFYKFLFSNFAAPNPLIFAFHLHDLFVSFAYDKLPLRWKLIYARNKEKGLETLDSFLSFLEGQGYTFSTLKEIVRDYKNS